MTQYMENIKLSLTHRSDPNVLDTIILRRKCEIENTLSGVAVYIQIIAPHGRLL